MKETREHLKADEKLRRGGRGVCRTSLAEIPASQSPEPGGGVKLERSGRGGLGETADRPPPRSAEPRRSVSAASGPGADAPRAAARAGSLQTVPAAASSAAALRLPRLRRWPQARSGRVAAPQAPGAAAPRPPRLGPRRTAPGGRSRRLLLLLPDKEVRAAGSGRSRRNSSSPGKMHAERTAEGAGGWARAASARAEGGAAGGFRAPPLCRLRGCPGRGRSAGPGVQPRTRLWAPTCPWQPVSRGGCRPPGPVEKRFVGFSSDCPEEGSVVRAGGGRWGRRLDAQTAQELWRGHAGGVGRAGGPRDLGARGGRSDEEDEGRPARGPRGRGCGGRAGALAR